MFYCTYLVTFFTFSFPNTKITGRYSITIQVLQVPTTYILYYISICCNSACYYPTQCRFLHNNMNGVPWFTRHKNMGLRLGKLCLNVIGVFNRYLYLIGIQVPINYPIIFVYINIKGNKNQVQLYLGIYDLGAQISVFYPQVLV